MDDFHHRVFTVPEAAAHLRISRGFLYALISERKIKPVKIGTRTLFAGTELARFIAAASDPPAPKKAARRAA
jgi:excisionase family DNA binding protein